MNYPWHVPVVRIIATDAPVPAIYDATDVFTPTGVPTVTYVYRQEHDLESQLKSAIRTPGLIVSLSGPSKSGKTVLINQIIPSDNLIPVSGASLSSPEQLWERVLSWMDVPSETASRSGTTVGGDLAVKATASTGVPLIAKGEIEGAVKGSIGTTRESSTKSFKAGIDQVVKEIGNSDFIIFIDDFHYMSEEVQVSVARQIKEVSEKGVKICTASVPHRSDDVVRSNSELRGRVKAIDFEYWSDDEIKQIALQGFAALNCEVPVEVIDRLTSEAFGSPQLMQSMCLQACFYFDVGKTQKDPRRLDADQAAFKKILEHTSATTDFSSLLEALHAGPKLRGQTRTQYDFSDGSSGDVYRCVLLALSKEPPALSFRYDEIYKRTRDVCVGSAPVGSSVNEALAQMAKLADTVQPSAKVVEWSMDVLDIADPYFLYYLRCSPRLPKMKSPVSSVPVSGD